MHFFKAKETWACMKTLGNMKTLGKWLLTTKTKIPPGIIQDHSDILVGKGNSPTAPAEAEEIRTNW